VRRWVGRHRRRVSEGMTGMRECPRDPTSMRRPMRAPCPPVVDETLPASPSGARSPRRCPARQHPAWRRSRQSAERRNRCRSGTGHPGRSCREPETAGSDPEAAHMSIGQRTSGGGRNAPSHRREIELSVVAKAAARRLRRSGSACFGSQIGGCSRRSTMWTAGCVTAALGLQVIE
jgi:hypothetical protein